MTGMEYRELIITVHTTIDIVLYSIVDRLYT